MKIAIMIYSMMNNTDGIARHAIYLTHRMIALGHQVTIWAVEYDDTQCILAKDLEVQALRRYRRKPNKQGKFPVIRMLSWLHSILLSYWDQMALARIVSGDYDIINPHGNLIIWSAVRYGNKSGIPVIWMCNDFWPPAYYAPKVSPTFLQKSKILLKQLISLPIKKYDQAAVKKANAIAVLSNIVKAQMDEYYEVSTEVVRLGVHSECFATGNRKGIRSRHSIPDHSFLLLTVCSLMPRRRLEDVIRAIEIVADDGYDILYLIAGRTTHTPEYTRFIKSQIEASLLNSCVLMIGEINEIELSDYYHACDAFIWPADENQSWGMAGTEAMASGKPVIISSANGLAEIVEDKVTGFLVPPRSPEMIAQTIESLINHPLLARSVGRASQRLICDHYTWQNNAQHMLYLFQRAINEKTDITNG